MKKIFLSAFVTASLIFSGCENKEQKEQHDNVAPAGTEQGELAYVCPCGGCPEVKESAPGKCPKCEMDLVEEKK